MALDIDLSFLKNVEGNTSHGVVPSHDDGTPVGNSGVTIGVGVDLGQQTEKTLLAAGMTKDEIRTLKPYIGLKKEAAQKMIADRPLVLSPSVVDRLSSGILNNNVEDLVVKFDKGSKTKFIDLPREKQTAIYSVAHQYGLNGAPKFMKAAMDGDWNTVAHELNNFGDTDNVTRLAKTVDMSGPEKISPRQVKVKNESIY